ncbi:MAG TPA: L,D-transpeptidase family protein [Pseudolabrys sp.]|nr:L,D-transpeptidase family protein [Pseudolabrys sp.]
MASAAIAATIVLAGCDTDSITMTGRAQAPLSDKMVAELEAKQMDKGSPILVRIFKEEAEMEVWKQNRDGEYALLKTYPVCRWSGDLGPKIKEGDRQAPEGFYTITPGQMNPRSNYYLAFNTGYPNAFDRAWNRTGSELMVHGDCSSRGCYAMTDEQMQEIYALARESFFGGQKAFQLQAYPFRMTPLNMAKHRNNPNMAFWKMLKVGYDHFAVSHQEPKVDVCERRYVFDAVSPDGSDKPLNFSPKGKCPVYQIAKNIAEPALEKRREDEQKTAEYVAEGVKTVAMHTGVDGGMNPVFAAAFQQSDVTDNSGRVQVASGAASIPGYLPRSQQRPNAGITIPTAPAPVQLADASPEPAAQPLALANVPVPRAAPQPKVGHAPEEPSIASFIGNLFSTTPEAKPAAEPTETAALRGTDQSSAKKKAPPHRIASAPKTLHVASTPKPQHPVTAAAKPATLPPAPEAKPVEQAKATPPRAPQPEVRTAYSGSTTTGSGLLTGAQPMVPAGTFASRWQGLR